MFKKTDWIDLIRANLHEIGERGKELYAKACDGPDGVRYDLNLFDDGELAIGEYIGQSWSAAVWKGDGITVLSLKSFNPFDSDPMDWFPQDADLPDLDAFLEWAKENSDDPEKPTLWDYEKFNEGGYKEFRKKYVEDYVDAMANEWVDLLLDLTINELKENAR